MLVQIPIYSNLFVEKHQKALCFNNNFVRSLRFTQARWSILSIYLNLLAEKPQQPLQKHLCFSIRLRVCEGPDGSTVTKMAIWGISMGFRRDGFGRVSKRLEMFGKVLEGFQGSTRVSKGFIGFRRI